MTHTFHIAMTGEQHCKLKRHLLPDDGKEAIAFLACSRRKGDRRHKLIVKDILEIPHTSCLVREKNKISWPVELIEDLLEKALDEELSVFKIHSHPSNIPFFSEIDDISDGELIPIIKSWTEHENTHGSLIMLPNGQIFGRYLEEDNSFSAIDSVSIAGDNLDFWYAKNIGSSSPDFAASHAQIFGEGTFDRLNKLSIAVIGCSGTGSPVIEMLTRLGVGEIILVDDDHTEERNINRIINATMTDAANKDSKVNVLTKAIKAIGLGTVVIPHGKNLWNPDVVESVAQCDIVFGCMDSIDGRYLLNTLSTYYSIPYFDIGVALEAIRDDDNKGEIKEACGTVHYIQPGKSSLMSRGLFNMSDVAAAGLRRKDPSAYEEQLKEGYIKGVHEQKPAVISLNMLAASLAVNELLARLHPYREDPNSTYASVTFSLASMELFPEPEDNVCSILKDQVGFGDQSPLLGIPELSVGGVS